MKKKEILSEHLNNCDDCQKFYEREQELKSKICQKLRDAYFCQCDIDHLKKKIEKKISKLTSKD